MARKPSRAVYVSQELNELLKTLDPQHKIRRWIEDMKIALKNNMFEGEKIRKRQIPRYYVERYGVNNLFHYGHPDGYRSCYTLHNFAGLGVCPVILDIRPHSEYERIFGYRGR